MNFKEELYEQVRTRKERRQSIPVRKLADGMLEVIPASGPGGAGQNEAPSYTVYFTPLNVLEMQKIKTLSQDSDTAFGTWLVIEKVEDEQGNKCFSPEDKPTLELSDWNLVNEINKRILKLTPVAEVKKTSEKTPSS